MARKLNAALWDQWRQRIARQRESGLSIVEFCRREELSSHGFHLWKRKLRDASLAGHPSADRRGRRSSGNRADPNPRRATVAAGGQGLPAGRAGFLELPVSAVRRSPWVELVLADGTVIRLPAENHAALGTVLRALRGEFDPSPQE